MAALTVELPLQKVTVAVRAHLKSQPVTCFHKEVDVKSRRRTRTPEVSRRRATGRNSGTRSRAYSRPANRLIAASRAAPSAPPARLTDVIVLDVDDELGERLELETAAPEPAGIREERSSGDARHVFGAGAFTG